MSSQAYELLNRARSLSDNIQSNYYDLGELLYALKEEDHYKLIDNKKYYSDTHSKWKQFCEDNLSVSYRTAQYWLNLYRYFTDMGISKDRISKIDWSKAKELIDFTDDTNVLNAALEIAETKTIQELKAYIAEVKSGTEKSGEDQREEVTFKEFKFKYYEAAAQTVDEILEEALKESGGDKNTAFFKICVEWFQSRRCETTVSDQDILIYAEEEEDMGVTV